MKTVKHGSVLKCMCQKSFKNVKLVTAVGCNDDQAAVASLPDKWTPRRGGPILAKYLKERQEDHEKVLQDLFQQAANVNAIIDGKVKATAQSLLAHITQNESAINCVVEKSHTAVEPLSPEARNIALKSICELHNKLMEHIEDFRRDAQVLEAERADGLRNVLRDQFQRLIAVGYLPLRDLLHDFDDRIDGINQQLLNNSRAYAELVAQLRSQSDERIVFARSTLNQLCLGDGITRRSHSACSLEERVLLKHPTTSSSDKHRRSSTLSIEKVMPDEQDFDACVSVFEAYRAAVMNVYNVFYGKLNDLYNCIGCFHYIHDPSVIGIGDLQKSIDKISRKLSHTVSKRCLSSKNFLEVNDKDTSMQKSLLCLGECLRDTYYILYDASHLWDAHMLRTALAQNLTIAAVEDMLTNNDTIQLANEVNFNIALAQLREMCDPEKLQQQYDIAVLMLDHTAQIYQQHHQNEVAKLEQFLDLIPTMTNTLMSEFGCFLEKYPREPIITDSSESVQNESSARLGPSAVIGDLLRAILETTLQESALESSESVQNELSARLGPSAVVGDLPRAILETKLQESALKSSESVQIESSARLGPSAVVDDLPRAILETKLQESALKNWKNEFLKSLEHNIPGVPDELMHQAQLWVDEISTALNERYSLKMVSHSVRLERLRAARDARLVELEYHKSRLNSHIEAIHILMDTLLKEADEFLDIDSPSLSIKFCQWTDRIQADLDELLSRDPLDPEVKRLKMCSYAFRLVKHRQLFEESLDLAIESFKRKVECQVQEARVSNVRIMAQIKLPIDGGRYAPQEAIKTCGTIAKAAEALELCMSRTIDTLSHRRSLLLSQADMRIAPMTKILGVVKNNKNGAQDKRKPTKKEVKQKK